MADDLRTSADCSVRYGSTDGTTWPISDGAEWVQRYGTVEAVQAQRMGVASIVAAYTALTDPSIPQYEAIDKLKRARRVAASLNTRAAGQS